MVSASPLLTPSGCLTRCRAGGGTAALMRSCCCGWTDSWTDRGCTGPCGAPPAPWDLCTPGLAGSSSPGPLSGCHSAGTGLRTGPAVSTAGSAAGAGSSDPAPATSVCLSAPTAALMQRHMDASARGAQENCVAPGVPVSSSCASAAVCGLKAKSVSTAGSGTELLPRAEPRERAGNLHTSGWLQHGCRFSVFSENKAGSQAKTKSRFKSAWCT